MEQLSKLELKNWSEMC